MSKSWEMEQFESKLSQAVTLLAEVSGVWHDLSEQENEFVTEDYPFAQSFDELVTDFLKWKFAMMRKSEIVEK